MNDDRWLLNWLDEIKNAATNATVLELGCGRGRDTEFLSTHGFQVVALDCRRESLCRCARVRDAMPVQADLATNLPFADHAFGAILASLSLHYFSWSITQSIMAEIKRVLDRRGMLLIRVNSTEDTNYGAGQGSQLEDNYYRVGRQTKRFFDGASVHDLLSEFDLQAVQHQTIDRYGRDKNVWEAMAYQV